MFSLWRQGLASLIAIVTAPGCMVLPTCEDKVDYMPQVALAEFDVTSAVAGRLDRSAVFGRLSVPLQSQEQAAFTIARVDGEDAVAVSTYWLPQGGKFSWTLTPGEYSILGLAIYSHASDFGLAAIRTIPTNLHFEARGVSYIGDAKIDYEFEDGKSTANIKVTDARHEIFGERSESYDKSVASAPLQLMRVERPRVYHFQKSWRCEKLWSLCAFGPYGTCAPVF